MIMNNFTVFLIVHVLCDFYLQSQKMADKKQHDFLAVLRHSLFYAVEAGCLFMILMPGLAWCYILAFVLLHALIDIMKYVLCNILDLKNLKLVKDKKFVVCIDQLLHIFSVTVLVYFIRNQLVESLYNPAIGNIMKIYGIEGAVLLSWIVKILLIHKPANIFISSILAGYRPVQREGENTKEKNAGRMIGTLERILMTIFITIQQYSAVGLVLTAKSIARYERISSDQEFAEYYLLGTLLSTIFAVCVAMIF